MHKRLPAEFPDNRLLNLDPVSSSQIGNVEGSEGHRKRWLERMHAHGLDGD